MDIEEVTDWEIVAGDNPSPHPTGPQGVKAVRISTTVQELMGAIARWRDTLGGASPLTTKGDLYAYDTIDTRLGIGTDGQVLTADSGEDTGLIWADVATGTFTFEATNNIVSTGAGAALTSSAADNFLVGRLAGNVLSTGDGNVIIGRFTGNGLTTGDDNICIGQNAGPTIGSTSDKLFIGQGSGTGSPLLYGHTGATAKFLTINGDLAATGEVSAPNYVAISGNPFTEYQETDAAADEKIWYVGAGSTGFFKMQTDTDATGAPVNWLTASRTGTVVNDINLISDTVTIDGDLDMASETPLITMGSDTATSGSIQLNAAATTNPFLGFYEAGVLSDFVQNAVAALASFRMVSITKKLEFYSANSKALTLDTSQNIQMESQVLSLGTTAPHNTHLSTLDVIEFGAQTYMLGATNTGGSHFSRGAYHNGTNWVKTNTEEVGQFSVLGTGDLKLRTAVAGVADDVVTWIDAIQVDNSTGNTTFSGEILSSASTTTRAGLNIAEGVAPTSGYVDGDVWVTAAGGFFARLNGVDVDLSASGGGGSPWTYTLQTGTAYTASVGDFVCMSNDGAGVNPTCTLPSGHSVNDTIIVKKTGLGTTGDNVLTIDANGSETIDGALTIELKTQYQSVTLISDGTNWLAV